MLCIGRQILNHWTIREVPIFRFFFFFFFHNELSLGKMLSLDEAGEAGNSLLHFCNFWKFPGGTAVRGASQVALVVKNPPTGAGDLGLILGSGRSPGGGHSNPLQYSCLENPMVRGAWWAMVHRVVKSQTQLKRLSTEQHRGWTWLVLSLWRVQSLVGELRSCKLCGIGTINKLLMSLEHFQDKSYFKIPN